MVIFAAQGGPYCDLAPGYSCWHEERELQRGDGLAPSLPTRHAQEIPRDDFFCLGKAEASSTGSLHAAPLGPSSPRSWRHISTEHSPGAGIPKGQRAFPAQLCRAPWWDHDGEWNSKLVMRFLDLYGDHLLL